MERIAVKKLRANAVLPAFGTAGAGGADLHACIEEEITIAPGKTVFVPTGLAMAIPHGYVGLIYARSGLACKRGLAPANKVGVIDSDYRGEFVVALYNQGTQAQAVCPGERIAQLVITPVLLPTYYEAEDLDDTQRGTGGFGSTGR